MVGTKSAATSIGKGSNSAGIKPDSKAIEDKLTISKKVGDPKVSEVSSSTPGSRFLSLLQENIWIDVSSSSSESDED